VLEDASTAMAFSGRLAASFDRLSAYSWAVIPGVTEHLISQIISWRKTGMVAYPRRPSIDADEFREQVGQTVDLQLRLWHTLFVVGALSYD
jgi:hypothetical protein